MGRHRAPARDRLIVFGRYPSPGRTKTRLIPALGPAGAAHLQRRLTEKVLDTVKAFISARNIELEIRFEGGSHGKMQQWLGSEVIFSQQEQGDLGHRMHSAFLDAFQRGCNRVVLVGTDIPELKPDHLSQAFDALKAHDLVVGPSMDGGYWLIGLTRRADLSHGIDWGTGRVLEQTLVLAKRQGLRAHLLESLKDIDTVGDLEQWQPDCGDPRPYISVIIPALNEAANIEATIDSARDPDAEIIVVDGGSRDSTVLRATQAGVRVKISPAGRALQQNLGAKAATGRVLLFLHADTHLPCGYVGQVFEALLNPHTACGAFRFKTDLKHPLMKVIEFAANLRSRYLHMPYGDQGLFVLKALFDSVGGFPEVPIAEDLLLVRRLADRGRIVILPTYALTSGRRWQILGLLRTSLTNLIIMAGFCLGFSPQALASLYRIPKTKQQTASRFLP